MAAKPRPKKTPPPKPEPVQPPPKPKPVMSKVAKKVQNVQKSAKKPDPPPAKNVKRDGPPPKPKPREEAYFETEEYEVGIVLLLWLSISKLDHLADMFTNLAWVYVLIHS